jgi:hypothetical protein
VFLIALMLCSRQQPAASPESADPRPHVEESEAGVTDEMMAQLEQFMENIFMGEEVDGAAVKVWAPLPVARVCVCVCVCVCVW